MPSFSHSACSWAVLTPGSTTATKSCLLISIILSMPSMETTMPGTVGTHPPERLVPRPRGCTATRCSLAQHMNLHNWSVLSGRTMASTVPVSRLASEAYTRSTLGSNETPSLKSSSRNVLCSGVSEVRYSPVMVSSSVGLLHRQIFFPAGCQKMTASHNHL